MGLHGKLRDSLKGGRDADIDHLSDFADGVAVISQRMNDLLFTLHAVLDIFADFRLGFTDQRTMAGQNQADVESEQALQRCEIIGHVAVGRMDDRRAVAENIIAAE